MRKILFSGTYMFIMKKIVFISFQIMLWTVSFAQLRYFFHESNGCFSVSEYKYWFNGDTIINGLKYKAVYMQYMDSVPNIDRANYYAAVREDTLAEKVYCFQAEDTVERLLYDFSLTEGDEALVYNYWPWMEERQVIVEDVDSILVNGSYRKRIVLMEDCADIVWWIEGIGSTLGTFEPAPYCIVDGGSILLLCVHIDGELIYQYYPECYYYDTTTAERYDMEPVSIYPTVTNDILNIEHSDFFDNGYKYSIYNILGDKIADGELDSDTINVSCLKSGMYMIVLYKFDNIYSNRFIKK